MTNHLGLGVDSIFDETLNSLGIISQRHAKQVIDSILRWRRTQLESVGPDLVGYHMSNPALPPNEISGLLNERKSLSSIYIMCRALISVARYEVRLNRLGGSNLLILIGTEPTMCASLLSRPKSSL